MSNRCRPVVEWPSRDRAAWAAAFIPGDPLAPSGLASQWASVSCRLIENGYGRWITWLDERGELDPLAAPEARITHERVKAFAADLRAATAAYSVQTRLQQLGNALRAMAPAGDWQWILRAADRIRSKAKSVRNKRARLQSPDHLAALGKRLMAEAASIPDRMQAAMTYRDGLIIALLAHRPIRGRNLTMISCGRHLVRRSSVWWLMFEATETKAGRPLEFPLPAYLGPYLERYLSTYRPHLLSGGRKPNPSQSPLWISRFGTPMVYASIAHGVRRRTRTDFGTALSPHLFRDCAATFIAILDPEHVRIIAVILGQSTLAIAEKHYIQAQGLEAGRRYLRTRRYVRDDPV
jgi:integrase/recombinase XerD